MPEHDLDDIGPDGRVRLRCHLPYARLHYLAGTCSGPDCVRTISIGIEAAIAMAGSGEATSGQLERRLRCRCGGRVTLHLAVDNRPPEYRERDGRMPETMGVVVRPLD
jgi:hypothetical protein